MIAIIDYGMGNIHSVAKALQFFGEKTRIVQKPDELKKSRKIVLPGVGAFSDAKKELGRLGLDTAIKDAISEKKIFLGICLGMQLLFGQSQEASGEEGFGFFPGEVKKFSARPGVKVPHMGWNQLQIKNSRCPLLKDVPDGAFVYFCHSYYPQPLDKAVIAASTNYGIDFASVAWKDNLFGVQFHPEKSQSAGLKMLENFVKL